MPEDAPITRAEVEAAYRVLLGRMPENEAAYEYGLSAGSLAVLRAWIMNGQEFLGGLQREPPPALRRWMLAEMQQRAALEAMAEAEAPEVEAPGAEEEAPEPAPAEEAPAGEAPRIVFLHIMKTAGSSLRVRLEQLCPDQPVWRREVDGRPGDVPVARLAPYRLFMGHFNIVDAWHIPGPKRVFTVLREPKARIISLYHFLARHREATIAGKQLMEARIARDCTLLEYLRHPNRLVRAGLQNHMTCVLAGDYVAVGSNHYRAPWQPQSATIGGAELLRMAVENMLKLDHVAILERLEGGRPRLMQVLGLPDLGPLARENTRELVSDTLEPREGPALTPEVYVELNRLTELDRMLYRLAQLHFRQ